MVQVKRLTDSDIKTEMLDLFDRYQETSKILVYDNGSLTEKTSIFKDEWDLAKKRSVAGELKQTHVNGGAVFGAYRGDKLVGFAAVEAFPFGTDGMYRQLSIIQVTRSERGQKIGAQLFEAAKKAAKQFGGKRLYISAHSSVESQAFYQKMGCQLAEEINEEIYALEPWDIQLELPL